MPLTNTKVKNTRPLEKEYKLTDGFGMFLRVHPNGSKYWQMAYRFEGKQKIFSIGVYPAVLLADARQRRDEAKRLLAQGIAKQYVTSMLHYAVQQQLTRQDICGHGFRTLACSAHRDRTGTGDDKTGGSQLRLSCFPP